MSNTRKPKSNATKNDISNSEPTKPAPIKTPVLKAAAAPAAALTRSAPVQAAPAPKPNIAVYSPKPAPAISAPFKAAVPVPAPKPAPAAPAPPKIGHISLELVQPGAKHVCVAGSFNEWKPEQTPLVQMGNGRWVGDLDVKPGRHEYLFVVDGQWLLDPNAKESVQNPFGGRNSILTVSA
jgi:hypothetical protein